MWGWRPELYFASRRSPGIRYVCGLTARKQEILADLERFGPPAAILVPGALGLGRSGDYDPYDLRRHPRLVAWMEAQRYALAGRIEGTTVFLAPPR